MPKIRHIALATLDPEKTAAFFKEGFGFAEIQRFGDFTGGTPGKSYGMYLSDGTLCLAIIRFGWSQAGKPLDFVGVHHFGIQVENLEEYTARIEALGAEFLNKRPAGQEATFYEAKFLTPDRVLMDIAEEPWAGSEPIAKP